VSVVVETLLGRGVSVARKVTMETQLEEILMLAVLVPVL